MTNAASSYLQQQNELQTKDLNYYSVYIQAASCGGADGKTTGGYDPANLDIQKICRAYSSGYYDGDDKTGQPTFLYSKNTIDPDTGFPYTLGKAIAQELQTHSSKYSSQTKIATDSYIITGYQNNGQTKYNQRQQTWNSLVITPTNATVQFLQNTMSSSNSNITTLGKCLQSLVEAQQSLLQIIQKWQA
jgi:hypothetical protein